MSSKNIELNEDQQLAILKEWNGRKDNPPYIGELIELVFSDIPEDLKDGRSKYGRAVKKFLAEKSLTAKVTSKHYPKEKIELTEDQNKDVRYAKGKIISVGNQIDVLKEHDIIHYDKHAGHGIQWKDKLYYVLKIGDVVLVE